jgi:3-methyl-2-oxobutanoate hydroxymethyltransferase
MWKHANRTARSKFCSHLATSELKAVWTRSKEPPNKVTPFTKPFTSGSNLQLIGETCTLHHHHHHHQTRPQSTSSASAVESLYATAKPTTTTKPTTIPLLKTMKKNNTPITMITAYDYTSGLLCDKAGADILLVGDSVGMVVLGMETTVAVTMEDMLHHAKAVKRATSRPLVVCDMPFGSYLDPQSAATNACRLIKEGGCDAVKLEGGQNIVSRIRAITENGMAVQGHIGLLPQQISSIGGYRVQGKNAVDAMRLMEDALALQEAGCFSIVLEMVPDEVATAITHALDIPTIGIGAGPNTSGQVQVFHDVCGLYDKFTPKFSKQYASLSDSMTTAVFNYCSDVRGKEFPTLDEHTFTMPPKQHVKFVQSLSKEHPLVALKVKQDKAANASATTASSTCPTSPTNPTSTTTKETEPGAANKQTPKVASSLIAEQWRLKMIQAYHQEALVGAQRATLRQFSSLATSEAAAAAAASHVDDEYTSYVCCNNDNHGRANVSVHNDDERQHTPLVATTLEELRTIRHQLLSTTLALDDQPLPLPTIGFVPTMGSLHQGHLNLVQEASQHNDIVVVSIYVNPTQFGANDDLDVYPRDLQQDLDLLGHLGGVDVVYAPTGSLYNDLHQTWVVPDIDGEYDEGASRPGFFRGVATVVTKLLNHVQPNAAYFGQKDAQQAAVIQDLVRDLDIGCMTGEKGLEIEIVPTAREPDGLAMSSRNAYLSTEERTQATALYEALSEGRRQCLSLEEGAVLSVQDVQDTVRGVLKERGIGNVEYVTVADVRTTKPMPKDHSIVGTQGNNKDGAASYMIATAAKLGSTRLIDNVVV